MLTSRTYVFSRERPTPRLRGAAVEIARYLGCTKKGDNKRPRTNVCASAADSYNSSSQETIQTTKVREVPDGVREGVVYTRLHSLEAAITKTDEVVSCTRNCERVARNRKDATRI